MNLTDHIINVALLGTATRELITTDFPEELQETLRDIQAKAEDAEALFYQQSALGFAFARAGVEAQSIAGVANVTEAPEEDKPYFLRDASSTKDSSPKPFPKFIRNSVTFSMCPDGRGI